MSAQEAQPKKKNLQTHKCFFCAEEHEKDNDVGYIKLNDGEYDRNIYVCHHCASESLKDMMGQLIASGFENFASVVGKLMINRAFDSRTW